MSDEPDEPDDVVEPDAPDGGEQANDDAASPKQHENKRRRIAREKQEALDFWRAVFASEVGRREMFALLQSAHTFEERFACGPNGFPQPEATWFQAGEQAFGQRLYQSWARDHRAAVLLMHDENDARFVTTKSKARK
ncbi:hypothetical protein SAMN05216337_1017127 [Bradyrhizobium brasilense]|uniref:Uncharacterized protein n=1 Tax=Bradyrhizobium brasilense TaxID=1419277 RepID=A0A1G6YWS9_9BRAD|nr:hypothetical protein [Bradyrhizobium brasilense]SDD94849.1 hypothetical protein SAMN05216337_1017127 [Bradyrhizobium brasilense]